MGLESIIGFEIQEQNLTADWGTQSVRETLLIKMDSPLEDVIDVVAALPAYGTVGASITFTIGLSQHPLRSDLILKSSPGVRPHPAGPPFWWVDLEYQTAEWINENIPGEPNRGRSGRNRKLNGTATIIYPWDEPPTWSGSSKSVRHTTFHKADGKRLVHANYLPLVEGIDIDLQLEQHQFTWNVAYSSFSYSTDIAPYVGKLNSATCFGVAAKKVYLDSCTAVENYRTVNIPVPDGEDPTGATETHHYVTITATFLIDRRSASDSAQGYWREANRRTDMHTMQYVVAGGIPMLLPIQINDRGDVAEEPWPLTILGAGYPYSTINTANPLTDFAVIDPEYPETAALHTFVSNNGLSIP